MLYDFFKPMEPVAQKELPVHDGLLYQVKWDGVRIAAHVGKEKIILHNRKFKIRTGHYPELDKLKELVGYRDVILDGEIVALKSGRPSFPLVLERDLIGGSSVIPDAAKVRRAQAKVPIFYMVFDIIYLDGEDLTSLPLIERQEILGNVLRENDEVHLVESFSEGEALWGAVKEQQLEGVLIKKEYSPYRISKKHPDWVKVKNKLQQLVAIGGYTLKSGQINSLLAGVYHKGAFYYVGRVATGLRNAHFQELNNYFKEQTQSTSPFVNIRSSKDTVWVKPTLVALIEFQEWTEDLRLRQPVVKGFTGDRVEDSVID